MEQTAKHILFSGQVQGVGFRYTANRTAARYNLTGFVRNLPDGKVEVNAEGERERLEKLAGYLQAGPPAARVARVKLKWGEPSGQFTDFRVRY